VGECMHRHVKNARYGSFVFDTHAPKQTHMHSTRTHTHTHTQVEEEQQDRGRAGALEASLVQAGIPVTICKTHSSMARGFYAEVRALMDQVFPSEGPDSIFGGGWAPACGKGWWRPDTFWRECRLSWAYQDMCVGSAVQVPVQVAKMLEKHCAAGADSFVQNKPLVLIDDTDGTTASVLLAIWARQYATTHAGQTNVIYHKVGLIGDAAPATEVAVIIAEIRRLFGLHDEVWEHARIPESLADWLKMADQRGALVLVIDSLEALGQDMCDVAAGLWKWMPQILPASCRVILCVGNAQATAFQSMRCALQPQSPFITFASCHARCKPLRTHTWECHTSIHA
jgi:hypothetical protein